MAEETPARSRDADLKREGRRAEDRHKHERRKLTSGRKWQPRGEDDLADVEASVREDTARRSIGRSVYLVGEEARAERSPPRAVFSRGGEFGRGFSLFDD